MAERELRPLLSRVDSESGSSFVVHFLTRPALQSPPMSFERAETLEAEIQFAVAMVLVGGKTKREGDG